MNDLTQLIPALVKFQSECPSIPKDKENPFFENKVTHKKCMYADLLTIVEKTRKPLSDNGLSVLQLVNKGTLETVLYHTSGQILESEMDLLNDKNTMQGLGSAITYARRYAMSTILGIVTEEDDDGNGASGTPASPPKSSPGTTTPPPAAKPPTGEAGAKSNPSTPLQHNQINSLWQDLGKTEAQLKAQLKQDMQVDCVEELTGGQAGIVVAGILGLLKKAKAEQSLSGLAAKGGMNEGELVPR